MLDDEVKERLKALSVREVKEAVAELTNCLETANREQREIIITEFPWFKSIQNIFSDIPDILTPGTALQAKIHWLTAAYIEINNPELFTYFLENRLVRKDLSAHCLQTSLEDLREIADEIKHTKGWTQQEIPFETRQFLGNLTDWNHQIHNTFDTNTDVESYIYFILKDVKLFHPEIYQQYQELCRAKTGDTPLLQAVKQTISHKYFSGSIGSFCPLYLPDILNSPQFMAMGTHPKHQLILLDMIDLCNYLDGSRKGCSIETNGFHYTWSDCRIEVSEDAFRYAVKDIVSRGWFKVISRKRLDDGPSMKMYVPSADWKKKRLSDQEITRIQDVETRKQKRISDSKERYRNLGREKESGIEHTFSDSKNTHSQNVLSNTSSITVSDCLMASVTD